MIDEPKQKAKWSKKVDGGDCNKLRQSIKKIFSQIKTQTFTKLRSAFFFSIKKALKLISKGSICCAILTRLTALSNLFLPKIISILSSQNSGLRLKKAASGYVLILFLATLPVLLWGAKYVLDQRTLNEVKLKNQASTLYDHDGSKAALAVAQNWNPGLTLNQQKDAVYKIADAIYNSQWGFALSLAVPGLDIPQYEKVNKQYRTYDPLQVKEKAIISTSLSADENLIKYTSATNYTNRRYYKREKDNKATWNPNYALWRSIDVNTRSEYRQSKYDEINESARKQGRFELIHHDIYKDPSLVYIGHICRLHDEVYYPNNTYHSNSCDAEHPLFAVTSLAQGAENAEYSPTHYDKFSGITEDNYSSTATKYKVRPSLNPDPVEISIAEDDSIKVTTGGGNPGYAEPAQCNVDIVLAIPVNGAANNESNTDAASDSPGTPLEVSDGSASIPSSVKNTPIYQMGQACKKFVKDHFYHTRGVTMGLIPYSAKVSLSPDKVDYTTAIAPFNSNTTPEYQQSMIGSCLYSTSGVRGANLTQGYKTTSLETNQTLPTTDTCYYWGGILTGCPIMCRRGVIDVSDVYGGNASARGLLLDTTDAKNATDPQYKFMRMNLNPCYMGYANLLSMQCEKQCTHFLPNPYYMIEPTADMVKIYEMCNALYPIYDKQNVSNFIFIPLEWTLNFWQSWTDDPGKEKVSGEEDTSTLSVPSKMEEGRKKALILLVNKPDWFEPGELTYLGFDNDASEIPMAESDKIDFSIDYSDTSKKFLDGTNFNTEYTSGEFKGISNKNSDGTPLVAGPKKIIKYEKISGNMARDPDTWLFDDVEGTSVIRLKIPRPAQVKITVDRASRGISRNWKYYPQALNPSGYTSYTSGWVAGYCGIAYGGGRFVVVNSNRPYPFAYSSDGITWDRSGGNLPGYIRQLTHTGSYFVGSATGRVTYSSTGTSWSTTTSSGYYTSAMDDDISWDGTRLFSLTDSSYVYATTNPSGSSGWSNIGSSSKLADHEKFQYGGGYYIHQTDTSLKYSTSLVTSSFTSVSLPLSGGRPVYGPRYWLMINSYGALMKTSDACPNSWSIIDGSSSSSSLYSISGKNNWKGLCYGDGKLVAVTASGDVAVTTNSMTSTIQSASLPSTSAYTITNVTTLTVDPSKITETDDEGNYIIDFTCTNLELISAEVTNCIIDTVNPISVTYNEEDFDGSNGVLSWSTRSVSEAARTIDLTNSAPTSSDGYCVEMTDSTGKLKIASDQLKYVNGYGWVPKHANQDVLLKITSNHGGALTLNVGKWDNGTISFYSDNIGSTSDVHRDTLEGTTVSLPSQQIITADDQKFVFKGGGTNHRFFSGGPNFERNLSVKKVRYLLSNATITNCVLKDQLLREYIHLEDSSRSLILNDGTIAQKISGYDSPRATFGIPAMSSTYRSDIIVALRKFRDSCMIDYSSDHSLHYADGCLGLYFGDGSKHIMDIYGVTGNCIVYEDSNAGTTVGILASNGNYTEITGSGSNCWNTLTFNCSSYYSDRVRMLFRYTTCGLWLSLIKNTQDKTLQNTEDTAITTNPIEYQDLIENKGIYIYDPQDGTNTKWICFQGDGELEVTTKPEERDGLYYVKYNKTQTDVTSDSQDYSPSWYISADDYDDAACDSDSPRYATYILLHNVYLKSVTQAAGNKTVRILKSTKQQDIKLVVGPGTTGFNNSQISNSSYSYMRQGITYGDGMFVLVGGQNGSGNGSFYGIGSNSHTYVETPDAFKGVAYDEDDKYFYAVTAAGKIYRANKTSSNTLSSWSSYVSEGCPISGINRIACGNGHIVVQNTSAQSATYNKASGTWSGIVTQPATCYALCFGAGKFICMSYSTSSTVYSSVDGSSWTQIGSTTFSYDAISVCYGNGRFLATDWYSQDTRISTDGGSTWNRAFVFSNRYGFMYDICYGFNGFFGIFGVYGMTGVDANCYYLKYFYPRLSGSEYKSDRFQVKIGSRTPQKITGRTVFTIAASELSYSDGYYYVDVNIDAGYKCLRIATHDYNKSATVDDLIDFNSGETTGKNGILTSSASLTTNNGYYVGSGVQTIYSTHRGKFELRYSYSLESSSNTGIYTSTVQKTSMTHSGGRYYYTWSRGNSYVFLNLRFYHEPEMLYPYGFGNSLNLDWRDNSLGIPSGLYVSSYSNYDTTHGYHQFKQSNCSPTMYRSYTATEMLYPFASDISAALDVRQSLLANIVMPEYTDTGTTWLTGVTRLFSQQKRDSTYKYCFLQPNSTTYDNIASLLSTNFTVPINRVLSANEYQSSSITPTAAVSNVTAAACTKLKNTYGDDLRIYVVKYKPQANFNSFPYGNKDSVATAHDYTTVNNCASSASYVYGASTPGELNDVLDQIAQDIKSASFGNWQKAQNTE